MGRPHASDAVKELLGFWVSWFVGFEDAWLEGGKSGKILARLGPEAVLVVSKSAGGPAHTFEMAKPRAKSGERPRKSPRSRGP